MVQRTVHAAEESAEIAPVLRVGEAAARLVQLLVGQAVVAGILSPDFAHVPMSTGRRRKPNGQSCGSGPQRPRRAAGAPVPRRPDVRRWWGRRPRTWDPPKD